MIEKIAINGGQDNYNGAVPFQIECIREFEDLSSKFF
jgi:hypothetical protein